MHYHCEIVIPPDVNVEEAVASIMEPFDENTDSDDSSGHAFWDWYVIGGRFAGNKLLASLDRAGLDAFYAWMKEEKITVSGFQAGKPSLSPSDQTTKVDWKWSELFNAGVLTACPLFEHSNDQYASESTIEGDVMRLAEVPEGLTCSRVVFGGRKFDSDDNDWTGPIEATFMLCDSQWNGVNHMKIDWDGRLVSAVEMWKKDLERCAEKYKAKNGPAEDWLVVTVDYHS